MRRCSPRATRSSRSGATSRACSTGEWAEDAPASRPAAADGVGARDAIGAAIASIDFRVRIAEVLDGVVARRLEAIAAQALDEVLDADALAELQAAARELVTAAAHAELGGSPRLYYASLPQFVEELLLPMYRRSVSGQGSAWCPEWWRHAEAITRLEALWRSWEHLRLDPATGMSVWLRDHADHHMAVLLSADGPFKGCRADAHSLRPLAPLPSTSPPEGLFEIDV